MRSDVVVNSTVLRVSVVYYNLYFLFMLTDRSMTISLVLLQESNLTARQPWTAPITPYVEFNHRRRLANEGLVNLMGQLESIPHPTALHEDVLFITLQCLDSTARHQYAPV